MMIGSCIREFWIFVNHKGETIVRKIEICCMSGGINSIFTLIVDNASSNDASIKFLQIVTKDWKETVLEHEFLHMRYCAHILNLIMGDGLKEIDASITKVREAVRYVKSSQKRNQTFISFAERLGIESRSLFCLDVLIRWNSTYLMLEIAKKFEKMFLWVEKENSGGLGSPSGIDFQNCRTFVGFWSFFTMQQRSSLVLCMLLQMPFLLRCLLFNRILLI